MKTLKAKRIHRHKRVRSRILGTAERPRLSVFRSNKHIYAQIIDDENGRTLVGLSDAKMESEKKYKKTDRARLLGKKIGEKAVESKIKKVVFDRGAHRYHGRVKSLAEGAREAGLVF